LDLAGCDVQYAVDGKEALKIWYNGSFDLVITDLVMPNSDGLELICEIRRQHSAVKIIAISGGGSLDSAHFLAIAKKLGADYSLLKPFTLGQILETVQLALPGRAPEVAVSVNQTTQRL
jgi:DNA-binding response OmpR family regulator